MYQSKVANFFVILSLGPGMSNRARERGVLQGSEGNIKGQTDRVYSPTPFEKV